MRRKYLALSAALCAASPGFAEESLVQVDQSQLNAMVQDGRTLEAFIEAFDAGDELTEFSFRAEHGVGAHVGEGRRFARFPRADLKGETEWASHFPAREGGPNATSCIACHNAPFANGAGDVALNVLVDPDQTGDPRLFLERNTLPLFALGIPQRLAEEMTAELAALRSQAEAHACANGTSEVALVAKGVSFGQLRLTRSQSTPCTTTADTTGLEGIDTDLVVRAFGWKGNEATIRGFTRGAAHNELGLQAVELVGSEDGDYDGVTNELTVGDMTALTIYMAGLERPVSRLELDDLGLIDLEASERAAITAGQERFAEIGCASCHIPQMPLENTLFSEPSTVAGFYDETFPDGSQPLSHGLTQTAAITFDLAADQPNNRIETKSGAEVHLGALRTAENGMAMAEWYTDFKRHDMGDALADPSDPLGIGASMFLTPSLAGVGATGPWLHDGRATSLSEAIRWHGGAAQTSAGAFEALDEAQQNEIVAFLENLTLYQSEADDH